MKLDGTGTQDAELRKGLLPLLIDELPLPG